MRKNLIKKLIATVLSCTLVISGTVMAEDCKYFTEKETEFGTFIRNCVGRKWDTCIYSKATCGAGRIGPIECWVYLETSDHRIPYKNSGERKYHDKCAEVFIDVELTVPVNMHTTFGSTLDGGRFVRGRYFTA